MCTKKGAIISNTETDLDTKQRKYHNDSEKKTDAAKKRYNNKKNL